jgi:hypothetical protein
LYACALSPAQARDTVLPLTRLRLYETGVGYFERSGSLAGLTRLPVPAAQLDDALKTLVVLGGEKDGTVDGVAFSTRVTEQLGRALARLPTDSAAVLDYEALARSLTGSQVELVARGQHHKGRLLQVITAADSGMEHCVAAREAKSEGAVPAHDATPCVLRKDAAVLFMRDTGELMRFALSDLERLRPLAPGDLARLRAALESTAGAHASQHTLQIRGTLAGQVTLGYVVEAPLWRTTYRLVLGERGATLQAWALLHNDTDEPWTHVHVELVNGQPDSFLFPFAAPRYARRRLVTPENELPSVPQLLARNPDELWDRADDDSYGFGGLGASGYGAGGGGFSGQTQSHAEGDTTSSLLAIGDLSAHAEAQGQETGALFRYTLPAPIDLAAHDSLLVPLLRQPVTAERVSYFENDRAAAQSALLMRNTTQQTLPAGTLAIFEEGGFGGESALTRLKPGEQRLLPFGLDLDVEIEPKGVHQEQTRKLVSFKDDQLIEHFVRTQERRYTLRNRSGSPRTVQLGLSVVNNARIEHADAVVLLEGAPPSAVYKLDAQSTRAVQLTISEGLEHGRAFKQLSAAEVARLAADTHLPAAQRAPLAAAAAALADHAQRVASKRQLSAEIELLKAEAARLKDSLPLVAKADPERGRALAAELVRSQARLSERERKRAGLDPQPALSAARAALAQLEAPAER